MLKGLGEAQPETGRTPAEASIVSQALRIFEQIGEISEQAAEIGRAARVAARQDGKGKPGLPTCGTSA